MHIRLTVPPVAVDWLPLARLPEAVGAPRPGDLGSRQCPRLAAYLALGRAQAPVLQVVDQAGHPFI
eukprot:5143167-Pyramimonas_sp.AAC.1